MPEALKEGTANPDYKLRELSLWCGENSAYWAALTKFAHASTNLQQLEIEQDLWRKHGFISDLLITSIVHFQTDIPRISDGCSCDVLVSSLYANTQGREGIKSFCTS
jgi:hypothetical protein